MSDVDQERATPVPVDALNPIALIVPGGNRFFGRQSSSSPGGSYTLRKTMTRLGR